MTIDIIKNIENSSEQRVFKPESDRYLKGMYKSVNELVKYMWVVSYYARNCERDPDRWGLGLPDMLVGRYPNYMFLRNTLRESVKLLNFLFVTIPDKDTDPNKT